MGAHPRSRRRRRCAGEQGQALPLLAVVLVIAGLVGLGAVHVGRVAVDRARAQAAADAAALAGAAAGTQQAAARVARADGASLVAYRAMGSDTLVTVELAGCRAAARARAVRLPAAGSSASPPVPGRYAP